MCHFMVFSIKISLIYRHFFLMYEITEVLVILIPALRITDLPIFTIENTEVSVIFTDGWQHSIIGNI